MAESLSDRAARFAARARGMLPKGRAWARFPGARMFDLLTGTTYEFARVEERSDEFSTEMDPTQTSALLPEWESALGLPGDCVAPTTDAGRRAAIITRLTDSGTNTEDAIRNAVLAVDPGALVEFGTPTQFEVGADDGAAGMPIGADEWAHTRIIRITNATTIDREALECTIDEIKRAHGHYLYEYMSPPISGAAIDLNPEAFETVVLANAVDTLADDSGNDRDATQSTASKRPAFILSDPDFGNRASVSPDGTDDGLVTSSFQPGGGGTGWTVYGIIKTGSTASTVTVFGQNTGAGTGRFEIQQQSSGTVLRFIWDSPGGSTTYKDYTTTADTVYRFAVVFAVDDGADAIPLLYINGADSGATYGATAASNDTEFDTTALGVGSNVTATGDYFDGKLGRLIGYDAEHTTDDFNTTDSWMSVHFSGVLPAAAYGSEITTEDGFSLLTESGYSLTTE